MNRLYERWRPRTLADVIGQEEAVAQIRGMVKGGLGGRAIWLSGPSGVGKTSLGLIVCGMVADQFGIVQYDSGDDFTRGELDRWRDSMGCYGWNGRGRALLIDEAHGIRADVLRTMQGTLERLPTNALVVFTTTKAGQEALFEGIEAGPLLSRCDKVKLTNQGLAEAFAPRLVEIAKAEGVELDRAGAVRLMREAKNNMRDAVQAVARLLAVAAA